MLTRKALTAALLLAALPLLAQQLPYQNPRLSPLERARDLCSRLTLQEKSQLMRNGSPAIPRLGIPQFEWWSEGLHGIGRNGFATVFPQNTGMAASWDEALLRRVFQVVSDEAVAKNNIARRSGTIARYQGVSLWTPNVNIFRDPRWGRGMETYGEDPFLTSRLGLAVVNGLQSPTPSLPNGGGGEPSNSKKKSHGTASSLPLWGGTGWGFKTLACAKHFAVHSGPEWNRHIFNIENLPERDLWETYLPAFKTLVTEGKVREVMCAYQRIDGQPCCSNNRYLAQILRGEWKYDGLVVSDCGAIGDFYREGRHHVVGTAQEASAMAVRAGTDVECGGVYASLPRAVEAGLISEATIDTSVVRLLRARFEVGDFDDESLVPWKRWGQEVIATPANHALALQMARESMTLLQNDNSLLPLSKDAKIAVMGPNANDSVTLWGNYNGYPTHTTTILQGIMDKAANVTYVDGCGYTHNEIAESHYGEMTTPDGQRGMLATYWNNTTMTGQPAATAVMREPINLSNGGNTVFAPGVRLEDFSAVFEGTFTPAVSAKLTVSLACDDKGRVIIDGDTVVNNWKVRKRVSEAAKTYSFEAGRAYRVRVEYVQEKDMAVCQFDIVRRAQATATQIVAQVGDADVVVFAGGISPRLEGEEMSVSEPGFHGGDRTTIELPTAQRDVVRLLREAGKRVVFVNCSGGAVALVPESRNCDAILQAWYGGEAGGRAVADVLFGDYCPSGKLPVTFYGSDADLPDFLDYRMTGRTYRYFRGQPLFAFGYGLSYTSFAFGKPRLDADGNGGFTLSVDVANTGSRKGAEVVQVYVRDPRDADGPLKTLRAFSRVELEPGQKQTVTIALPRSRFELWDASSNTMSVRPGTYDVLVGNSSRAQDLQAVTATVR